MTCHNFISRVTYQGDTAVVQITPKHPTSASDCLIHLSEAAVSVQRSNYPTIAEFILNLSFYLFRRASSVEYQQ